MKIVIKAVMILSALMLVGCLTKPITVRENPDFAAAKRNVQSIAILPADVEITYVTFNGDNEREHDKEASTAQALDAMARQIVQDRGYTVKDTNFTEVLNSNSDMAFDLTQLKTTVKTAVTDMYEGKGEIVGARKPPYFTKSVGAAANPFSDYAQTEALMLIDYKGFEKSSGMIAKDLAANILLAGLTGVVRADPNSGAVVNVTLVDGVNGDILWTNTVGLPSAVGSSDVLKKALTDFRQNGVADVDDSTTDKPNKKHNTSVNDVTPAKRTM